MQIPDIRVGKPLPRTSETTGKPLAPIQYVWHPCRTCSEMAGVPLGVKGFVSKSLGRCVFCGGKR